MIIEMVAVTRDSRRASRACGLPSTVRASAHGARTTSPTRGSSKNSSASTAGTPSSSGTRLCQGGWLLGAPASGERTQGWAKPAFVRTAWPSGDST